MVTLKVLDIQRDLSLFQFRAFEYKESRVQWLVDNWDANTVDPLDVWDLPSGKFLLSGHHRHESMVRLGIVDCECRLHTFSIEEARLFAAKSNANRLEYTTFEYSKIVTFLVDEQKVAISAAANEITLSVGMAKKFFSLRFLVGTDWEKQCEKLDLASRAYEIGGFCEVQVKAGGKALSQSELQSLFKIVVDNDLNASQVKQLLRDIKRQQEKAAARPEVESLFDLAVFSSKAVKAVKERDFLDKVSAEIWWLVQLVQNEKEHQFPPELQAELIQTLKKVHAYCIGSDDVDAEPARATGKGRKLRVNLDDKAS